MLVLSSESLFESAITQINALGLLRRAWFGGKAGIVARFTQRAAQLVEEKQILIIQNLKSAISNEGEDNLARSLLNGKSWAGIQINPIFNIDIAIFQKINIDIDIA